MITHIDTPTAVFQLPGQPGLTSCPLNCQSPPVITILSIITGQAVPTSIGYVQAC